MSLIAITLKRLCGMVYTEITNWVIVPYLILYANSWPTVRATFKLLLMKTKENRGGKRPYAGRKRRFYEPQLQYRLECLNQKRTK